MKGISPMIAAVLLIAFTVAISTLVAGWFSTQVRSTTDEVSNKTDEAISCTSASINIEDVYISQGTGGTARIIIKNNGFKDGLTINGIQIYNKTGHNFSTGFSTVSGFDRGQILSIEITNTSFDVCPSSFSQAVVTTTCGGVSDTHDKNPKCQ